MLLMPSKFNAAFSTSVCFWLLSLLTVFTDASNLRCMGYPLGLPYTSALGSPRASSQMMVSSILQAIKAQLHLVVVPFSLTQNTQCHS